MLELFSFDATIPLHLFDYVLKKERTEQHWHSFYEIGYCLEGRGSFFIGDEVVPFEAGTLMLFPPYEPHIAMAGGEGICRCAFVYFGETLLPEEDRFLLRPFVKPTLWSEDELRERQSSLPPLRPMFEEMLKEYETKPSAYGAALRSRMLQLGVLLYRAEEGRRARKEWRERNDALRRLKPALDELSARFREPIELRDVARWLSLSESRSRHLFVEGVGKRFKEYLSFVRVQEAKRLLATTEQTVTEIYLSCGFQSAAPFYRSFGRLVGLNPRQYRSRHREENSRF